MEIEREGTYHVGLLDAAGRAALGGQCTGAGAGAGWGKLLLDDLASPAYQQLARDVLEQYGMLLMQTDKTSIAANDVELATITCSDAALAEDATVDYRVWRNGDLWASGTAPVTAGTVTLEFGTNLAGRYLIAILRQYHARKSGYVWVEAG